MALQEDGSFKTFKEHREVPSGLTIFRNNNLYSFLTNYLKIIEKVGDVDGEMKNTYYFESNVDKPQNLNDQYFTGMINNKLFVFESNNIKHNRFEVIHQYVFTTQSAKVYRNFIFSLTNDVYDRKNYKFIEVF
jgi:hypothetical protein